MERRRRQIELEGDREARSIALSLGRVVREARRRRRMTQEQLALRVGLRRSRLGEVERGTATGTPLLVWVRLGLVLGRPLAMAFSRDLDSQLADAGHLDAQECLLRMARATGRSATFELPTRPESPLYSVDACIRDDANRTLILNEIWNRFGDMGRAVRSTDRKVAEAETLAAAIGGDNPYRVAWCWLLVDSAANRALVGRYPEILTTRFPAHHFVGSGRCRPADPSRRSPGSPGSMFAQAASSLCGGHRAEDAAVSCSGHA